MLSYFWWFWMKEEWLLKRSKTSAWTMATWLVRRSEHISRRSEHISWNNNYRQYEGCLLIIYYGDSGVWYSQHGTAPEKFMSTFWSLIVIISCKSYCLVITLTLLVKKKKKHIQKNGYCVSYWCSNAIYKGWNVCLYFCNKKNPYQKSYLSALQIYLVYTKSEEVNFKCNFYILL